MVLYVVVGLIITPLDIANPLNTCNVFRTSIVCKKNTLNIGIKLTVIYVHASHNGEKAQIFVNDKSLNVTFIYKDNKKHNNYYA